MAEHSVEAVLDFLVDHSAKNLPPDALADLLDRFLWCLDESSGSEVHKVRRKWLIGEDEKRVSIALAMEDTFPADSREGLVRIRQTSLSGGHTSSVEPTKSLNTGIRPGTRHDTPGGHKPGPMERPGIRYVLLYSTPERWRFTVGEDPDAMACGDLDISPEAAFEEAEQEFRKHIERHWGHRIDPDWQESKPEWWGADLNIPPSAASDSAPTS